MPKGGIDVREFSRQTLAPPQIGGALGASKKVPAGKKKAAVRAKKSKALVEGGPALSHSPTMEFKDPLFDLGDFDAVVIEVFPSEGDADIYEAVTPLLREAIVSGDFSEILQSLNEVQFGLANHHHVVETIISIGYDARNVEREVCSQLLAYLSINRFLSADEMKEGFNDLLDRLENDVIDVPHAPQLLAKFIARAIVDDCVAPCFVNLHPEIPDNPEMYAHHILATDGGSSPELCDSPVDYSAFDVGDAGDVTLCEHQLCDLMFSSELDLPVLSPSISSSLHSTRSLSPAPSTGLGASFETFQLLTPAQRCLVAVSGLINSKQRALFIEEIWGQRHDHGRADIGELTQVIRSVIADLQCHKDVEDAALSLRELMIPHFLHEAAYQVLQLAIRDGHLAETSDLMVAFLIHMQRIGVMSLDQLETGLARAREELGDLILDIPRARENYAAVVAALAAGNAIAPSSHTA